MTPLDAGITLIVLGLSFYALYRRVQRGRRGVNHSQENGHTITSSNGVRSMPIYSVSQPSFETKTRAEIPQEIQRNSSETPGLDFIDPAQVEMLARLVHRGALGKTDAIKIGLQFPSGEKYQKGKAALDLALAQLDGSATKQDQEERLRAVSLEATSKFNS